MKRYSQMLRRAAPFARFILLAAMVAAHAYAQSPFSQTAQGAANEIVLVVRSLCVIAVLWFGWKLASSDGAHAAHSVAGMVVGLVCGLFAPQIVAWIQSIG